MFELVPFLRQIALFTVKSVTLKTGQSTLGTSINFHSIFKRMTKVAVVLSLFVPPFLTYLSQGRTDYSSCSWQLNKPSLISFCWSKSLSPEWTRFRLDLAYCEQTHSHYSLVIVLTEDNTTVRRNQDYFQL